MPASPTSPNPTAAPIPSPTPILDAVIDSVVVGQQNQLYASGYGNELQLAQWDGARWIALDPGFQLASNALAVDSAGRLNVEVLTNFQQGMSNAIMKWDGASWEDITGNFNIR
jgi:hypothetical protein